MIKGIQNLVNAQVCVNRAVFESNRMPIMIEIPYLLEQIRDAIQELQKAEALIIQSTGHADEPTEVSA